MGKTYSCMFLLRGAFASGIQRSSGSENSKDIFPQLGNILPCWDGFIRRIRHKGISKTIINNVKDIDLVLPFVFIEAAIRPAVIDMRIKRITIIWLRNL